MLLETHCNRVSSDYQLNKWSYGCCQWYLSNNLILWTKDPAEISQSKLHLVHFVGSEKVEKTGLSWTRLVETQRI